VNTEPCLGGSLTVTGPQLQGKFNHPTVCWEGSRAWHKQPRRFLEVVEGNIWTQTLDELTRAGLLLTEKVDVAGDGKDEGSHGFDDHELVEK